MASVTETRNTRVPSSDTGEEWRTLGFYHEPDTAAHVWRFTGSITGLRTLVRMLKAQADKADADGAAGTMVVGPYADFKIRIWERPGIDDESVYGRAADLRRLSRLLETKLSGVSPGQEFAVGKEYTADIEYRLVFAVREETFDPASVVPAVVEPEELVDVENRAAVVHAPVLAFKFHDPDAFVSESEGMIRVEDEDVIIEHQTKDAFLGAFRSDVKVSTLPVAEISWIKFKRRMFSAEITIQARAMKSVENMPTSKQGRLRLRFARDLRDEAEHLADVLQTLIGGLP